MGSALTLRNPYRFYSRSPVMHRRAVLATLGTAAGGIAGCLGDDADDELSPPDGTTDARETTTTPEDTNAAGEAEHPTDIARPRIVATTTEFERVKQLRTSDDRIRRWVNHIHQRGSGYLITPPKQYHVTGGGRLLQVSREVLERVQQLAFLYRVLDDEDHRDEFADRVYEELEAVANFPDWNPDHFLDTAEMTAAVAIGYDWCYAHWSPEQRATIQWAILEHGLSPARDAYYGVADFGSSWWPWSSHNWNFVCNGGIAMGALALLGDESVGTPTAPDIDDEFLADIVDEATNSIQRPFEQIGPNGGWFEGVGYWVYGMRYMTFYLTSIMNTVDPDPAFLTTSGLDRTGDYPIQLTGPGGAFNYGDGRLNHYFDSPQLWWLADQFDRPAWATYQAHALGVNASVLDVLWYNPDYVESDVHLPFDAHFPGGDHAVSFRTTHDRADAPAYLACKAGDNTSNHTALDVGAFVLDAYGRRWALHWGSDNYNLPGYWDRGQGGQRWTYYRMRPEGQNTLVVNPTEAPSQNPLASATIDHFTSTEAGGIAIMDLTDVYAQRGVASLRRGFTFDRERPQVIVQDELAAPSPVELWWFMHTDQEIAETGRTAILTTGGSDAQLRAHILEPAEAQFERRDPVPLPSSPNPYDQAYNPGEKLAITLEDVADTRLTVQLAPVPDSETVTPDVPTVPELDDWTPGWW